MLRFQSAKQNENVLMWNVQKINQKKKKKKEMMKSTNHWFIQNPCVYIKFKLTGSISYILYIIPDIFNYSPYNGIHSFIASTRTHTRTHSHTRMWTHSHTTPLCLYVKCVRANWTHFTMHSHFYFVVLCWANTFLFIFIGYKFGNRHIGILKESRTFVITASTPQ